MDLDKLIHESFDSLTMDSRAAERIEARLQEELTEQPRAMPDIMTLEETATYLRITPDLVYDLMKEIPCFELGGRILFRKEAVNAWIEKREEQFAGERREFESMHGLKLCM